MTGGVGIPESERQRRRDAVESAFDHPYASCFLEYGFQDKLMAIVTWTRIAGHSRHAK